jgi:hypothetical protein
VVGHLREKLTKVRAKNMRFGRHVAVQLAELIIPRILFTRILRLTDALRARATPTAGAVRCRTIPVRFAWTLTDPVKSG